ncbi:MAG: formate dehydrogenase subunit gamma, partial [Solirubrobacteraceae bacterium]|nr:formate dehydrogenase subunit gamma [Solirubrobacteraceae bacterium]
MAVRPAVAPRGARVVRFSATERNLHTIHGSAFVVMTLTGLVLYLPMLAQVVSSRPLTKAVHLGAAVAWLTALALVALLGDRRALRQTRRELERFDADDLRWLR